MDVRVCLYTRVFACPVGCTGCRVGCDASAACPFGCSVNPVTGNPGFCRRGCNITTGDYYDRSSPRVCTTDVRDYADGKVNMRCALGWRKKDGSSPFGCKPVNAASTCPDLARRVHTGRRSTSIAFIARVTQLRQ